MKDEDDVATLTMSWKGSTEWHLTYLGETQGGHSTSHNMKKKE